MTHIENAMAIDAARHDEQIKTLFRRIDEIQHDVKDVQKLVANVERMATNMETITEKMSEIKKDVADMKKEPGDNWKKLTWGILMIVVGAVVGIALTQINLII